MYNTKLPLIALYYVTVHIEHADRTKLPPNCMIEPTDILYI